MIIGGNMKKEVKKTNKSTKQVKNNAEISLGKILTTLNLILSIGFFSYSIISTDNIITNINNLSIPILILIISFIIFIHCFNYLIWLKSSCTII